MQNFHFMSRKALRLQIAGNRDLLLSSGVPRSVVDSLAKDPRTATKSLHIDPVLRTYVSCPTCHTVYPHDPNNKSPTHCISRETPHSSTCNQPLWKESLVGGRPRIEPRLTYQHQDFKQWLGRLLSRKGIEELLDSYPAGLNATRPTSDIWLADVFQQLKDHEGNPFLSPSLTEGRLVFGLSVDSFEPNAAKPGQTPTSATGIWIICYNFPPHLRYLPENIYLVGIIPGPTKPDTTHINPYIQLVVDEFKPFWNPGVSFSRTRCSPNGRHYLALLIPLICDMLAARQIAGKPAAMAHNLCTICDIDHDDMDILDPSKWPLKDRRQVLFFANLWKNARCTAHQSQIFDAYGQRWSPLFDLPYWDPIRFIVIDTMHTLDINLLKGHLRDMFRIDLKHPGGDGASHTAIVNDKMAIPKTYVAKLPACNKLIADNPQDLLYKLLEFHRTILYVVCVENTILGDTHTEVIGTRWILARNIVRWVSRCIPSATLCTDTSSQRADVSHSSVQRFLQKQVPIQAVTTDEPLNMWLSDSDDEDLPPNEIGPMPVEGVIRVETPDPGQMVDEILGAENVEPSNPSLAQDTKLHSSIRKILTYLASDASGPSREHVSQRSTIDVLRRICHLIDIDPSSVPSIGRNVKLPLVDAIIEKGFKFSRLI